MSAQQDHIILKCTGDECGMRYPSPVDDPRRDACPLCESPVLALDRFSAPPPHELRVVESTGRLCGALDNIRSALNVGMMLRSADGAGLDHLYLGGLTAPVDNPKVIKTALGAQESVPTTSALDGLDCVKTLQSEGSEIWAIDFTERSEPLQTIDSRPHHLTFVVGNERAGVDPAILELADRHVHLDMHGAKSTLNVGATFGVVAYVLRSLPLTAAAD